MQIELREEIVSLEDIWKEAGLDIGGGPTPWGQSFWKRALLCTYDGVLYKRKGFGPALSDALILGSLVHACLYVWYKERKGLERSLAPTDVVLQWCLAHGESNEYATRLQLNALKAQDIMRGYAAHFATARGGLSLGEDLQFFDFAPNDVYSIEQKCEVSSPFPYSARFDLVVSIRDSLGNSTIATADHKTHSRFDSAFETSFFQDGQIYGHKYLWDKVMIPQGYPAMTHAIINVIDKPSRRNDPYGYRRIVYPLTDARVSLWVEQMTVRAAEFMHIWNICEKEQLEDHTITPLWKVATQNYAACFERRYNGGVCKNLDHCLALQGGDLAPVLEQEPPVSTSPTRIEDFDGITEELLRLSSDPNERQAIEWLKTCPFPEILDAAKRWGLPDNRTEIAQVWLKKAQAKLALPEESNVVHLEVVTEPRKTKLCSSCLKFKEACEPDSQTGETCSLYVNEKQGELFDIKSIVPSESGPVDIGNFGDMVRASDTEFGLPYYVRSVVAWRDAGENKEGECLFFLPGHTALAVSGEAPCVAITVREKKPVGEETPEETSGQEGPKLVGEAPLPPLGMAPIYYVGHFDKGSVKPLAAITADSPYYGTMTIGVKNILRVWSIVGDEVTSIKGKDEPHLIDLIRTQVKK